MENRKNWTWRCLKFRCLKFRDLNMCSNNNSHSTPFPNLPWSIWFSIYKQWEWSSTEYQPQNWDLSFISIDSSTHLVCKKSFYYLYPLSPAVFSVHATKVSMNKSFIYIQVPNASMIKLPDHFPANDLVWASIPRLLKDSFLDATSVAWTGNDETSPSLVTSRVFVGHEVGIPSPKMPSFWRRRR